MNQSNVEGAGRAGEGDGMMLSPLDRACKVAMAGGPAALHYYGSDVNYLVLRYSLAQLRGELNNDAVRRVLDINESYGPAWFDTTELYLLDYGKALLMAIDIKSSDIGAGPLANSQSGLYGHSRARDMSSTHNGMRGYTPVDTQAVKAKVDIVSVVGQYVRLKRSGNRWYGRCALHNDTKASLVVYANEGKFYCYGCHRHGDVIDFLMMVERIGFKQAVAMLKRAI